ncbi:unnamed protein product [Cylicocyclus nassatus]|uniref:VWFA domain-containing protein n=1 Tax=Cylicocyclus nassatus TaxID=53992 RepID=A0AA36GRS3_CYLNA|nr:unnamed protein product [Cylicocyclus nassatus]
MDLSKMRIKLQLGGSKLDGIPAGTLFYELPEKHHFHVCARPARAFEQTLEELEDRFGHLGLPSGVSRDLSGRIRPFTYVPLMLPVRGDHDKAHVQELHEACKVFPYGYVASLGEFQDTTQFNTLKSQFPSGLYRTTIARMHSVYDDHVYDICNPNKLYEVFWKKFRYYGPHNNTLDVPQELWKDEHPMLICVDLPRITVAISNAYVDIPAMARRALICTYGNNPNIPALQIHEQCSQLAHYDEKQQRCVCDSPKFEAKTRDPQMYDSYPEGIICLECFHLPRMPAKGGAIVFILSQSQSTTYGDWFLQKVFMQRLLKILPNALVAIMVNNGWSHVEISMDYYEFIEDQIDSFLGSREFQRKWSALGPALYKARLLLLKAAYPSKFIVLFNDGNYDTCPARDIWCSQLARTRIRSHDVNAEADAVWAGGIEIIYILFGTLVDTCDPCKKRVQHVAGGYNNVIRVRKLLDIDATIMAKVSKKICNKYPSTNIFPGQ